MAWQNSAGMGGSGGSAGGGSEAGNSGGQQHGTEYTLQGELKIGVRRLVVLSGWRPVTTMAKLLSLTGVMRFLQTEWHRHERDRNAWQIERAEMKLRIGKLEGDGRTNKRLRESMDKHIRILEHALKKEREKAKAVQTEGQTEEKKEDKQETKQERKPDAKRR